MQKRRSEVVERTFAHLCETGGCRRSHLRGLVNVTKRYVIAAAAHNLGRILRKLKGIGKPRTLQGSDGGLVSVFGHVGRLWWEVRTGGAAWRRRVHGPVRTDPIGFGA